MSSPTSGKPPRIVAELGRPETPEETAARKARNTIQHRANQTLRNLIYSLVATLALVLLLVVVVVRPDPTVLEPIDYQTVAAEAQVDSDVPLIAPELPSGYTSNSAELTTSADGVSSWYVGLVTPSNEFVGFTQGIESNPTWIAQQLDQHLPTGTDTVDGVVWDIYDYRDSSDPGNLAFAMVATFGDGNVSADGTSYVLFGTADSNEFRTVAASIGAEFTADGETE